MKWVKVREKIMALFALVVIIVFGGFLAVLLGWNVPFFSDIAASMGYTPQ